MLLETQLVLSTYITKPVCDRMFEKKCLCDNGVRVPDKAQTEKKNKKQNQFSQSVVFSAVCSFGSNLEILPVLRKHKRMTSV